LNESTDTAGFVLEDTLKLAMPARPGGQKLALRHEIRLGGYRWKYEPIFVLRRKED